MRREMFGRTTESIVETVRFQINGGVLKWDNVVVQIKNISYVTTMDVKSVQFPRWTLICELAGLLLLKVNVLMGILAIVIGLLCIWGWYHENEQRKKQKYLYIHMNSGRVFSILFSSSVFLDRALDVFSDVMENGNEAGNVYNFNLKDCKIDHESSLIGNMKS